MTVTALLASARAHRASIVALDVVHIDDRASTQTPIAPDQVETWPSAFHHHVTDAATIDRFFALVEDARPEPTSLSGEVRWKLTFKNAAHDAVLTVYHDSFEPYGTIDGAPVKFANDALLHALRDRFAKHEASLDKL